MILLVISLPSLEISKIFPIYHHLFNNSYKQSSLSNFPPEIQSLTSALIILMKEMKTRTTALIILMTAAMTRLPANITRTAANITRTTARNMRTMANHALTIAKQILTDANNTLINKMIKLTEFFKIRIISVIISIKTITTRTEDMPLLSKNLKV